jgi:hypothetical protein
LTSFYLSEFQPDDGWSESDDGESVPKDVITDLPSATHRIHVLEKQLASAKRHLIDYQAFVGERLNLSHLTEAIDGPSANPFPLRDDDSHYFESYGENGKYSLVFHLRETHNIFFAQIFMRP